MLDDLATRAARITRRLDELAAISETADGLTTRTFGSEAMRRVNTLVGGWLREAGLPARVDGIGNLRGFPPPDGRPLLVLGSHLDTVREAGRFDGPLGVLVALECAGAAARGEYGPLAVRFGVVGFSDEEGVRFGTSYLGSDVLAGDVLDRGDNLIDAARLALTDRDGVTLAQAIRDVGGDPDQLAGEALDEDSEDGLYGYVEVHIEQGPVLEAANLPVGVVSAIAGQSRFAFRFEGRAGHAGTVPMNLRRDALAGAAEFVTAVETHARLDEGLVATVGQLDVKPGAGNVIPGSVAGSLDVRSPRDEQRRAACDLLNATAAAIANRRGLTLDWRLVQEHPATHCSVGLRQHLSESVARAGYPVLELVSGAGHDAVALAHAMQVGMLFVRCRDGLSHHPDEFASVADIAAALNVMDKFLFSFTKSASPRQNPVGTTYLPVQTPLSAPISSNE